MGLGVVDIVKLREEGATTIYSFSHEGTEGEIGIDTVSGEVWSDVKTGNVNSRAQYAAASRIRQAWREGDMREQLYWSG